jgi:ABC-type Fe3+-citrate transport system substrate-binding protein
VPFGFNSSKDLAVLEGKFQIYEDLSKETLEKLERAVEKISEGNQQVALILAKHEEKIEQGIRADELIVKMIEEMREMNSKEHGAVISRIEKVENKISDLSKFRWIAVGIATAAVISIGSAEFFSGVLTMGNRDATMGSSVERVK